MSIDITACHCNVVKMGNNQLRAFV